jgi:hypothetical protein
MKRPTLMFLSGFLLGALVMLLIYQNDQDALQFIATPSPYPVRIGRQIVHGSVPGQNTDVGRANASMADTRPQSLSFAIGSDQTVQFSAAFISLVEQLRAAGVSDETLAGFVQAEFMRQWLAIAREMQRKTNRGDIDQGELQRFYADIQSNQNEAIKALLGDEAYSRWERQNALQKEYEQQTGSVGSAESRRNNDWSYVTFRRQLKDLNLSDTQVDALYTATQQYNQKLQELALQNQSGKLQPQDYTQQVAALSSEREQEMQRILGVDGYAQYQKVTDSRYQQLKQYAIAWQLSPADIEHVYQSVTQAIQAADDYRKQAQTAGQGQPVNWQDIQKTADDYKHQAEDELRQYLGEDRFNKLKRAGVIQMDSRTGSNPSF